MKIMQRWTQANAMQPMWLALDLTLWRTLRPNFSYTAGSGIKILITKRVSEVISIPELLDDSHRWDDGMGGGGRGGKGDTISRVSSANTTWWRDSMWPSQVRSH